MKTSDFMKPVAGFHGDSFKVSMNLHSFLARDDPNKLIYLTLRLGF